MIDEYGVHPVEEKVQAIKDAPPPSNVSELKSYLGLITYYSKFLPNKSDVLAPLHTLLRLFGGGQRLNSEHLNDLNNF